MARIIVIEADARTRRAMVKTLERRGHEVVATTGAEAGLEALAALPPDLLVVDVATLGKDARASVRSVRSKHPAVSIVAFVDPRVGDVESLLGDVEALGRVRTLGKPFRQSAFLDVVSVSLAEFAVAEREDLPRPAPRRLRTQQTVLLIDDDAGIRRSMRMMLEDAGFRVYEAADGYEGLALYRRYRPTVSIVDIIMPGKDGVTTIGEIRMLSPRAKIVAISGADPKAALADLAIAQAYGAGRSLQKPFGAADLLATIAELLSDSSP